MDEALEHPFLKELHCPEDEPISDKLTKYHFDFELHDLTRNQYKGKNPFSGHFEIFSALPMLSGGVRRPIGCLFKPRFAV